MVLKLYESYYMSRLSPFWTKLSVDQLCMSCVWDPLCIITTTILSDISAIFSARLEGIKFIWTHEDYEYNTALTSSFAFGLLLLSRRYQRRRASYGPKHPPAAASPSTPSCGSASCAPSPQRRGLHPQLPFGLLHVVAQLLRHPPPLQVACHQPCCRLGFAGGLPGIVRSCLGDSAGLDACGEEGGGGGK